MDGLVGQGRTELICSPGSIVRSCLRGSDAIAFCRKLENHRNAKKFDVSSR